MVSPATLRATRMMTMLRDVIFPKTSQTKLLSLADSPSLDGHLAQKLPTTHQ